MSVIENEIFYACRQELKKIDKAIELLKKHKYIIYKKNENTIRRPKKRAEIL